MQAPKTSKPQPDLKIYRDRMGHHSYERRQAREPLLDTRANHGFFPALGRAKHKFGMALTQTLLKSINQYEAALAEPRTLVLEQNTVSLESMPNANELKLLHLSDFHLDSDLTIAERLIKIIRPLKYDFAVITGDYYNSIEVPNDSSREALKSIINALEKPTYGILGNHDLLQTAPYIETMGIQLLINESVILPFNDKQIQITGIDDPHLFKTDDLEHAIQSVTVDANLKILLSHSPNHLNRAIDHGFHLMLCGHTHGGQICLKDGKPIVGNGSANRDTISGAWSYKSLQGYTSRGAGTGRTHYRLNCPPEITLHTIRF